MTRKHKNPVKPKGKSLAFFPVTLFLLTVALLCLGLGLSAFSTRKALVSFSKESLERRGNEIFSALDLQVRSPGDRSNPEVWQEILAKGYDIYVESVAFLAVVDAGGAHLAFAGRPMDFEPWKAGQMTNTLIPLYLFETGIGTRPQRSEEGGTAGWKFRAALEAPTVAATVRMADLHFLVAAIAIVTTLGLAFYSVWVLKRFVELQARESSERHLASLGRMAAILAHEIRNPLAAVKGLTQLAREQLPSSHRAQPLMDSVVDEAQRLERLVTDLLSFARPRRPQYKNFDLILVLNDLEGMLQPQLLEKQCRLMVRSRVKRLATRSDEGGLRQVLLNVFLNALEASPYGGTVSVSVGITGNSDVWLRVEDEGEGLGGRDSDELFEPFSSRKLHGTGLGLAISRRIIVENLNGSIKLEDRRDRPGAVCTIVIPGAAL